MKTLSDYRPDSLVSIRLYVDAEHMLDFDMQPDYGADGLGVSIANYEDFSLDDTADLLAIAQGSLRRFLDLHPDIEIFEGLPTEKEKDDPER